MNTGFRITGMEDLQSAIERAYSGAKAKAIQKAALNDGGDVVVDTLKKNFEAFKDTGYSQDDIIRTNARTHDDSAEIKVGWNGDHGRWRLVHLNEFGYTRHGKQYTPKGFGAIAKTIQESEQEYMKVVAGKLRDSL